MSTNINLDKLLLEFYEPSIRFAAEIDDIRKCLYVLKQKGIQIGIISNSPVPGYCHKQTLARLDLAQYFDSYVFSYDVKWRKPSPEIFEYALKIFDCKPSDCAMVGDNFILDIDTPSRMGMKSFWYKPNKKINNELQAAINNFYELTELL